MCRVALFTLHIRAPGVFDESGRARSMSGHN